MCMFSGVTISPSEHPQSNTSEQCTMNVIGAYLSSVRQNMSSQCLNAVAFSTRIVSSDWLGSVISFVTNCGLFGSR